MKKLTTFVKVYAFTVKASVKKVFKKEAHLPAYEGILFV